MLIISLLIITSLLVFIYKSVQKNIINNDDLSINLNDSDITNPRFTINSKNQKISITANKGNFINNDEILLKNNVVFESNKFTIFSDDVIFNKNDQTASSKQKSKFVSSNTSISPESRDRYSRPAALVHKGIGASGFSCLQLLA